MYFRRLPQTPNENSQYFVGLLSAFLYIDWFGSRSVVGRVHASNFTNALNISRGSYAAIATNIVPLFMRVEFSEPLLCISASGCKDVKAYRSVFPEWVALKCC